MRTYIVKILEISIQLGTLSRNHFLDSGNIINYNEAKYLLLTKSLFTSLIPENLLVDNSF